VASKDSHRQAVPGLLIAASGCVLVLSACTTVGPDYVRPESPLAPQWYEAEVAAFSTTPEKEGAWWERLNDPGLNRLVARAHESNNSLQIAGLRVLEARAQLGIATGLKYPQVQVLAGGASAVGASENAANTAAGDLDFTQFDIGATANWELDFWGRFRRGIEAADAVFLGSIAAYDQVMVLVTAQVAYNYLAIRTIEEQLRITRDNIASQQRSYDIVNVQYENGNTSELDVLQARTLLLSTQATVPVLESDLKRAKHALSTILGSPPGPVDEWLGGSQSIPEIPETLAVGIPADLLRQRPDVRQAEYQAMAQNANVGLATANLYPSFSIAGTLGLVAAGDTNTTRSGEDGIGQLFNADSLTYSVGAGFVWPFLNYGRIKNNIRVQDARLQQALTSYRETVIQAAREVEDAVVTLDGARKQDAILQKTVAVAARANEVALLRFGEGFADYQRVLDAQQALFAQQGRFVGNRSNIVNAFITLYVALGGGWQSRYETALISRDTQEAMSERTDWGDLINTSDAESAETTPDTMPRQDQ
jgi:NodT family efflux transporter outer membrane factor (OMF) lipoprotein